MAQLSRFMTRRRKSGLTLIELQFLAVAFSLLIAIAVPIYQSVQESKKSTLCKANLKSLGSGLELYYQRFKCYPNTKSGIQFLLAPLKRKVFDFNEDTIRNVYICPGDEIAQAAFVSTEISYGDLEHLDPMVISYAGRNTWDFPLRRKLGGSEITACDAGGSQGNRLNHRNKINMLFLDMSVKEFDRVKVPEDGIRTCLVGPDSQFELLRKLNKEPSWTRIIDFNDPSDLNHFIFSEDSYRIASGKLLLKRGKRGALFLKVPRLSRGARMKLRYSAKACFSIGVFGKGLEADPRYEVRISRNGCVLERSGKRMAAADCDLTGDVHVVTMALHKGRITIKVDGRTRLWAQDMQPLKDLEAFGFLFGPDRSFWLDSVRY